ncbi:hypothetical protein Poly30_45110 [Planctomycetes bacterium Poly30]|uniref:Uncharacterized protein n=1 Tax=Saltatorellus ferox TaxID=2528018 RepID=A0A518EXY3_9BACT|nr:hypothetical protein Poly30_45110 [Planctomycetes bacterium Poly30]
MSDSSLPVRRIVLFTVVIAVIVIAVIFLLEDPSSEFSYPVN